MSPPGAFTSTTSDSGRSTATLGSTQNSPQMSNRSLSPLASQRGAEPFNNSASTSTGIFSQASHRSLVPFQPNTPASVYKITIRGDPTLVMCFDPADKELYDLWAPKS